MSQNTNKKKIEKSSVIMLIALLLFSALVLITYRVLLYRYYFELVIIAYMAIETVFVLAYVIYNRGFSRRGVTAEMLPEDWSDEQKQSFIESGKERMRKSRWMLIVIFAFLLTFAVDMIELWVVPFLLDLIAA